MSEVRDNLPPLPPIEVVCACLRNAARRLMFGKNGNVLEAILAATHDKDGMFEICVNVAAAEAISAVQFGESTENVDPFRHWSDTTNASAGAALLKLAAQRLEGSPRETTENPE